LVVSLLYGGGLRLSEALRLRVKDIDFDYQQIVVRDGKGEKDRHTVLPASIIPELKKHLNEVFKQHKKDLANGKGATILPYALAKNIQMLIRNLAGNTLSHQRFIIGIKQVKLIIDYICMKALYNVLLKMRLKKPV